MISGGTVNIFGSLKSLRYGLSNTILRLDFALFFGQYFRALRKLIDLVAALVGFSL